MGHRERERRRQDTDRDGEEKNNKGKREEQQWWPGVVCSFWVVARELTECLNWNSYGKGHSPFGQGTQTPTGG